MAAAFLNQLADPTRVRGVSAGTEPAAHVHPVVVDVMREIGLDLSNARPQKLTDELAQSAALLVTMGCGEQCPFVPGLHRLDWELPDPKGQPLQTVRAIRDDIKARVATLVRDNGWDSSA
jgi:arsenate reductase